MDDEGTVSDEGASSDVEATEDEADESASDSKGSPDADTMIYFTQPNNQGTGQFITNTAPGCLQLWELRELREKKDSGNSGKTQGIRDLLRELL